jgi:hypothetical protein
VGVTELHVRRQSELITYESQALNFIESLDVGAQQLFAIGLVKLYGVLLCKEVEMVLSTFWPMKDVTTFEQLKPAQTQLSIGDLDLSVEITWEIGVKDPVFFWNVVTVIRSPKHRRFPIHKIT